MGSLLRERTGGTCQRPRGAHVGYQEKGATARLGSISRTGEDLAGRIQSLRSCSYEVTRILSRVGFITVRPKSFRSQSSDKLHVCQRLSLSTKNNRSLTVVNSMSDATRRTCWRMAALRPWRCSQGTRCTDPRISSGDALPSRWRTLGNQGTHYV